MSSESLFIATLDAATAVKSFSLPSGVRRIVARFVGTAHVGTINLAPFRSFEETAVSLVCPDSAVTVFGGANDKSNASKNQDIEVLVGFQRNVVKLRLDSPLLHQPATVASTLPLPLSSSILAKPAIKTKISANRVQPKVNMNAAASATRTKATITRCDPSRQEVANDGFVATAVQQMEIDFGTHRIDTSGRSYTGSNSMALRCKGINGALELVRSEWDRPVVDSCNWETKAVRRLHTFGGNTKPNGIALDGCGRIYVADSDRDCIWELDTVARVERAINISGLRYPTDVALSVFDELFVADRFNNRVCVLDSSRGNARMFKTPLGSPFRLAVDLSSRVFVLEATGRAFVTAYTFDGRVMDNIVFGDYYNCLGSADTIRRNGKLIPYRVRLLANAICVDRKQRLYVAITKKTVNEEQWLLVFEYF